MEEDRKSKKRIPFIYVDVNVAPGRYHFPTLDRTKFAYRSGRIGIHADDDPEELARNFALAFQLNNEMYESLQELITSQLEMYHAVQEEDNQA